MNYFTDTLKLYYLARYFYHLYKHPCFIQTYREDLHAYYYEINHTKMILSFWYNGLIEMEIHNKDKVIFYLHFKYQNYSHFLSLLQDMLDIYNKQINEKKIIIGIASNDLKYTLSFIYACKEIQKYETSPFQIVLVSKYNHQPYDYLYFIPQLKDNYLKHYQSNYYLIDTSIYALKDVNTFLKTLEINHYNK